MKKFVFLVIIATSILKDVQSYPVDSAVVGTQSDKSEIKPVVPLKSEAEPVVPPKSEAEPVVPPKSDAEPVVPPKSDAEPVVPPKSEAEPVVPPKSEVEPVVPPKSEAEPVAPTNSEVEPVSPTKPEVEPIAPVLPTKSEAAPVAPSKLEAEPVAPTKLEAKPDAEPDVSDASNTEPVVPSKPEAAPVAPIESAAEPVSPTKSEDGSVKPDQSESVPAVADVSDAKSETKPIEQVDPTKTAAVVDSPEATAVDVQVAPEYTFAVPNIPKSFENSKYGSSVFGHIWSNRLFQFHKAGGILRDTAERFAPSTILVASDIHMTNLVPQDAPHPLYSEGYTTLTDTFLSDFMSNEAFNPEDEKLTTAEGVTIKTKTGKDLVFKKDPKTNVVTVNGIVVTKFDKLPGEPQLTVVDIDDIPFDYRNIIDAAFKELSKSKPSLSVEIPVPVVIAVDEPLKETVDVASSPSKPLLTAEVKPKDEKPTIKT